MRTLILSLISFAAINVSAKTIDTNYAYACTFKYNDYLNGPMTQYYFIQIKNSDVYYWMDITNDHIPNLDAALKSDLHEVGIGQITDVGRGIAYVTGDALLSKYDRETYRSEMSRELEVQMEMVEGAPKGHATVITHEHDGRSKNPNKQLSPSRMPLECTLKN